MQHTLLSKQNHMYEHFRVNEKFCTFITGKVIHGCVCLTCSVLVVDD